MKKLIGLYCTYRIGDNIVKEAFYSAVEYSESYCSENLLRTRREFYSSLGQSVKLLYTISVYDKNRTLEQN